MDHYWGLISMADEWIICLRLIVLCADAISCKLPW